ncbi:MAG: putative neutral sphingomyelinase activation associated factor, partial [Streblomastix strix]
RKYSGRLKICARCLVFEPSIEFINIPVLKFHFKYTDQIREVVDTLNQVNIFSNEEGKNHFLDVVCRRVIEMKANNVNYPYKHREIADPSLQHHRFNPDYIPVSKFLPLINELYTLFKLPIKQQQFRLKELIFDLEKRSQFELQWLNGLSEKIICECRVEEISRYCSIPGKLVITNYSLFFQYFNNIETKPYAKYEIGLIVKMIKRRHML